MLATMEHAVGLMPDTTDGRYPQVSGMFMSFDPARPALSEQTEVDTPSRLESLVITMHNGTQDVLVDNYIAQGDLNRVFTVATNRFLQGGGDGFHSLANGVVVPLGIDLTSQDMVQTYIVQKLQGLVDLQDPPVDAGVSISVVILN